jgi:hypothetical protein
MNIPDSKVLGTALRVMGGDLSPAQVLLGAEDARGQLFERSSLSYGQNAGATDNVDTNAEYRHRREMKALKSCTATH